MSATNLIYPFATEAASENILSDGEYGLSTERLSGNVPGIAKQQLVNKAAKQAAAIAYAVAEAAALRTDAEISDDGAGLTAIVNYLKIAFIPNPEAGNANKYLRLNAAYNCVEYVSLPVSSTSIAGIIQTATTAEVEAGLDTTKAATSAGVKAAIDSAIEPLAPAASPTFTGTPQTVTPATSDNSTKIASTAYVINRIANDRPYSTATPAMNGTATAGSSANVSRGDHVHPVDTSRAAVNSPTFTGVPAAPTAPSGTNTTQLATTAFVKNAADNKVSDAIGDGVIDKAPSQNAVYDALLLKAPVASPALTGIPTVPTAAAGTNTTQAASTAFVKTAVDAKVSDAIVDGETSKAPTQNAVYDALASKADLASPAFTGTPSAPTAAAGTNTTQLATTAFVKAALDALPGASFNLVDDTTPALGGVLDAGEYVIYNDEIDNTSTTINWTKGPCQKKNLGANTTLTFMAPGGSCRLRLILAQDSTGSRILTLPSSVKTPGSVNIVLSTQGFSVDILEFEYDGTNYNLVNAVFGVA